MSVCCCQFDDANQLIDFELVLDPADCPGSWCVTPVEFDIPIPEVCPDACANLAMVNCCQQLGDGAVICDDVDMTPALCAAQGGVTTCPLGCSNVNCEDYFDNVPRPCCIPDGTCQVMEQDECQALGGFIQPDQTECDVEPCPQLACRGKLEPFYLPGDKVYSLKLCEAAALAFTRRPLEHHTEAGSLHFPKSQRGFMELITSHETRACRVSANADPCARHYAALVYGADGYVRPMLWSQPAMDVRLHRWNVGVFTVQKTPDPLGRVPVGYLHGRVGVENQPWAEVGLYADVMRCGILN